MEWFGQGRQIARGPKGEKVHLTYDACGRLIHPRFERDGFRPRRWRYSWDAHDRLVSVETPDDEAWLFRYDPFGRRVAKVRRPAVAVGCSRSRSGQFRAWKSRPDQKVAVSDPRHR
ncbi:RHS repeat protein [Jiella sp. KSK16Y-1]|uniref:RHS repeat protein n=1 Tax=Jiella mangrovi TaxID=2821407 RepID=A0ABS4BLF1_9HYPH|nr:RHS repeat protein [Jiella mangrovi]